MVKKEKLKQAKTNEIKFKVFLFKNDVRGIIVIDKFENMKTV